MRRTASHLQEYLFGPWKIAAEEVFVASPHCFAFGACRGSARCLCYRRRCRRPFHLKAHPTSKSQKLLTYMLPFAVNLKPVVPGHVLVSPKRVVARFAELSPEEVRSGAGGLLLRRPCRRCR